MIILNDRKYTTLDDDLYVNGEKIYEVTVNGEIVYPDQVDEKSTIRLERYSGYFGYFSPKHTQIFSGSSAYGDFDTNLREDNWAYGELEFPRALRQDERNYPGFKPHYWCYVYTYWVIDHPDMDETVDLAISATLDSNGFVDLEHVYPIIYEYPGISDFTVDVDDIAEVSYTTTADTFNQSKVQTAYTLPARNSMVAGDNIASRRGIKSMYRRYINTARKYRFYWLRRDVGGGRGYYHDILVSTYTPGEGFKNTGNPSPEGYVINFA